MVLQDTVFRRLPELLAPAGSPEALKAAVAAGADAVYLSGKRFGARKFAANFGEEELKEAMDYAHLRGVKVYVTVNTLIRDDELQEVARYLFNLYEMGADAVLVQDLGVVYLARQIVPDLELHASTQMTIHNSEGATWATQQGLKRVVLAREVSLREIEDMAKGTKAGIEVFVHGALCYCYSGQCLLSAAIGGRSGNRGMCAQPCRKPYVLLRGEKDEYGRPMSLQAAPIKEKFLISTRDLSVYRHLGRIVKSPVESIKIEGRMKSPEYVAIVTSIYRKALDQIASGGWKPSEDDMQELALAFNRDFTAGYLLGAKDIMGREMSDNRGVFVGTVTSYDSRIEEAAVKLAGPLTPEQGDGLVIQSPGQEVGMVVYRPLLKDGLLRLRTPERVRPGAKVYMTSSTALSRKAQKIVSSTQAQTPIDLRVSFDEGTPTVEGFLEGGKRIEVRADFSMEKAKSQPLTKEQIEAQLRRTGGTPFIVRKLEMDYPGGLFAPLGALNQLRRDLLARAEGAVTRTHIPAREKVAEAQKRLRGMAQEISALDASAPKQRRVPSLAVYADSLEAVRGAAEGGCRRIYFEPEIDWKKEHGKRASDLLREAKALCPEAELIWKWPKITRDEFLRFTVPLLQEAKAEGIMVEGMGAAKAVLEALPDARLYGASGLNVWNHLSVRQLELEGFRSVTLSPELSADQLALLISMSRSGRTQTPEMELIVQGSLEVMTTEDCIPCLAIGDAEFWGLQDFRRVFPLRADNDGRTHIFNSVETCLLDFMPRLFEMGLDGIAVDARGRTGKYAREMTEIYLQAINLTEKGGMHLEKDLKALKEDARDRSLGGITTGHFLKGLKEELS
jgi:putative protease